MPRDNNNNGLGETIYELKRKILFVFRVFPSPRCRHRCPHQMPCHHQLAKHYRAPVVVDVQSRGSNTVGNNNSFANKNLKTKSKLVSTNYVYQYAYQ